MGRLTEEMASKVVELHNRNESVVSIANEIGVSDKSVRSWLYKLGLKKQFIPCEGECASCGETYVRKQEHAKFCSQRCRNAERAKKEYVCQHCNKKVFSHNERKFCSKHCSAQSRADKILSSKKNGLSKPKKDKVCKWCKVNYKTHSNVSEFCTRDCRIKFKEESDRVYRNVKCRECGKFFTTHLTKSVYCGVRCANRCKNRRHGENRKELINLNGQADWSISIERLLKRDGANCHICGGKTDRSVGYNGDKYPNIDHVKPLAKGGTHTWGNVKVAHRLCNIIKSDNYYN